MSVFTMHLMECMTLVINIVSLDITAMNLSRAEGRRARLTHLVEEADERHVLATRFAPGL